MRFGAHCVLYGTEIASNPDGVLGRLARAGAEGCEIGQRFFGTENRDGLLTALENNHVEMSGMHCGGLKLIDLIREPEKAEAALYSTARFVAPMKNKNVIATGGAAFEEIQDLPVGAGAIELELHDPELVKMAAVKLNEMVKKIKDELGVQVHYHNHSWEFADNGLIWNTLVREAPDLKFALDIGWAAVSGFEPVNLLETCAERIDYVHLRDYKKSEEGQKKKFSEVHSGYVNLGTGDMNYVNLFPILDRVLGKNGWAIVEYEIGNFDETSYASALSYLRGLNDMMHRGR